MIAVDTTSKQCNNTEIHQNVEILLLNWIFLGIIFAFAVGHLGEVLATSQWTSRGVNHTKSLLMLSLEGRPHAWLICRFNARNRLGSDSTLPSTSKHRHQTEDICKVRLLTPRHLVCWLSESVDCASTPTPQLFYGPFPGPPGWAGARRELLDFMLQWKINRGRRTDRLAGRHSIQTNQCPPLPGSW